MKNNLKQLIEGAETLADILRDYEVHDSHDCEMLKDGRLPEGQDKFIGVARIIALQNELQDTLKGYSKESDEIAEGIAKSNPIFKAGIEAGHRSIYWLQGYNQAIKELLGEGEEK